MHPGNLLQLEDGLRCIDFEFTCVTNAVHDLSYVLDWIGDPLSDDEDNSTGEHGNAIEGQDDDVTKEHPITKKRAFLEAYLQSMGEPSSDHAVDELLLDAELSWLAHGWGPLVPWNAHHPDAAQEYLELFASWKKFVQLVRSNDVLQQEVLRRGFQASVPDGRIKLVPLDSPDRCIFEHTTELLRLSKRRVPLTLASHPGQAVIIRGGELLDEAGHYYSALALGPMADALPVRYDGTFLMPSARCPHGDAFRYCQNSMRNSRKLPQWEVLVEFISDTYRVLDVEDWRLRDGQPMCVYDKGTTCIPCEKGMRGQKFLVNQDGTISPLFARHLVLGARKPLQGTLWSSTKSPQGVATCFLR